MIVKISKSIARGEIIAPPSKSYAHRLLIGAALARGVSIIKNVELNQDITATLNGLKALGASYRFENNIIVIQGIEKFNQKDFIFIDAYESGSTLRFLIPISLLMGKKIHFKGTKTLMSRGLSVYEEIFVKQQIKYTKDEENLYLDGILKPGEYIIDGRISSQFITGLLFSLPLLQSDSKIIIKNGLESKDYVNITIDVLEKFGIKIEMKDDIIYIKGEQTFRQIEEVVESDYSNAAFLDAFNLLNGFVKVKGLKESSYQGDRRYKEYFIKLDDKMPTLDISNCVDLGPILMMMGCIKNGVILTGTKRLAIKESNRAIAMKKELEKFGAKIEVDEDKGIIEKVPLHEPLEILDGHNDHRIVMALAVMLSKFGGKISGYEAVNKSYPTFFNQLETLGVDIEYEFNKET